MPTRQPTEPGTTGDPVDALASANRVLTARLAIEERLAADAGSGLAAAVRSCHELTGMPAVLFDADGRLVCQHPPEAIARSSAPVVARALRTRSAGPALLAAGPATGLTRRMLAHPVRREHQEFGWLVLEERGAAFDAPARIVVERGAHRVAAEYLIQQRISRVAADARDALTRQLARGSRSLGDLRASAEYLGIDVDARRVLVHVLQPDSEPSEAVDTRLAARVARRLGVEVLHTRGSEGVLLLVEVDRDAPGSTVVGRVRDAVRTVLRECAPDGVAGLSRACEPADFAAAYREAREVARCLRRLREGPGDSVLAVDDLGPARLFLANSDSDALRSYVHGLLGPVLTGAPGMAGLLRTVQVWLECGRSIRSTAARLGLHENTIRLRLGRIEKVTGIDVSDTNGQLALQTGVLVLRLHGHPALPPVDMAAEAATGRITA